MLLLLQRCCTRASEDRQTDASINKLNGLQFTTSVCELDTDEVDVHNGRVQRSDGHFDLLEMQIFLYKGQERLLGYTAVFDLSNVHIS